MGSNKVAGALHIAGVLWLTAHLVAELRGATAAQVQVDVSDAILDPETGRVLTEHGTAQIPPGTSKSVTVDIYSMGECQSKDEDALAEDPDGSTTGKQPFFQYSGFWMIGNPPAIAKSGCWLDSNGERWGANWLAVVIRFNGFVGSVVDNLTVYDIDGWYDERDTVASFGMLQDSVVLPSVSHGKYVDPVSTVFPADAFRKIGIQRQTMKPIEDLPAQTAGASSLVGCYYDDENCWAINDYSSSTLDTLVFLLGTAVNSRNDTPNIAVTSRFAVELGTVPPSPSPTPTPGTSLSETRSTAEPAAPTPIVAGAGEGLTFESKIFIGFGAVGALAAVAGVVFGAYETRQRVLRNNEEAAARRRGEDHNQRDEDEPGVNLYNVPGLDTHGI